MTRKQLIKEAYDLFQEKELECSNDDLQLLEGVGRYLATRGIHVSREILDFAIDVLRIKDLMGLPTDASGEDIDAARGEMVEWLEALGWRRAWFTRPLGRAG